MATIETRTSLSKVDSNVADHGLKIEVLSATGMSPAVFVWQRATAGLTGTGDDLFVGVATPSDLEELPLESEGAVVAQPYYRSTSVELWFRSPDDFNRYRQLILTQVYELVDRVNMLETLEPQTTITYP